MAILWGGPAVQECLYLFELFFLDRFSLVLGEATKIKFALFHLFFGLVHFDSGPNR
jgi:hypothetical protein